MPKRRKVESVGDGSHTGDDRGRLVRFTECRLVRDGQLVSEDLWVLDGAVVNSQARCWGAADDAAFLGEAPRSSAAGPATAAVEDEVRGAGRPRCDVVRCGGHILAPGFYDLQLNGAFGVDFANPEHVTLEK